VAAFDGKLLGPTGGPKVFGDFLAFEPTLRDGIYVTVGDMDGDGKAELIAGGGPGGGPRVTVYRGSDLVNGIRTRIADFFAGDPNARGGVRVAVKNLDGDDRADLVTGAGVGAPSLVAGYLGSHIADPDQLPVLMFEAIPGFTGGVFVG
jgi:hypothetical protein